MRRSRAVPYRGSEGFTLLELMIALAVLSVGLLGVAAMQGTAIKALASGGMITIANNLVRNAAERITKNSVNAVSYAGMNTGTGAKPNCPNIAPTPVCATDFTEWQTRVRQLPQGLLQVGAAFGAAFATVTVTGTWQDAMGAHTVTLPLQVAP